MEWFLKFLFIDEGLPGITQNCLTSVQRTIPGYCLKVSRTSSYRMIPLCIGILKLNISSATVFFPASVDRECPILDVHFWTRSYRHFSIAFLLKMQQYRTQKKKIFSRCEAPTVLCSFQKCQSPTGNVSC